MSPKRNRSSNSNGKFRSLLLGTTAGLVLVVTTAGLLPRATFAYHQPSFTQSSMASCHPSFKSLHPFPPLYQNYRRRLFHHAHQQRTATSCVLHMSSISPATTSSSSNSNNGSVVPSIPNDRTLSSLSTRNVSLELSTISTGSSNGPNSRPWNILPRLLSWRGQKQARTSVPDYQWTKQNLAIAMPALLGLLADPVLSMVDTAFVGRSGPIDLAALGVCTSIFHMAFTVFRASTVATTSLVSSASTQEEKRQITKISLGFAGVMGSLVLLALRFGGPTMLATMGVSASSPLFKPACDYLFARCWAAPAVVGIVVAEGVFRGNDDNKTPLIASSVAAVVNLILDPLLMFSLGMGMAGAAWATAISQFGAAAMFGWRLWKRCMLPQPTDKINVNAGKVLKSILGANAAMLAKNFSMLVFYTAATAVATRLGPVHVATHQVCLSLFWLVTMWLDSGSVGAQLLLSKNMKEPPKAKSLTKYMVKYALVQGLVFSAIVAGIGRLVPGVFTSDPTVTSYIAQCLPHLAVQQTIVSICLVLEGLAIGGNQFKFTAGGTAVSTAVGLWQMFQATSVVDIWARAVNTFFAMRLLFAVIGVVRVHQMGLKSYEQEKTKEPVGILNKHPPPLGSTTDGAPSLEPVL
ncbi:MATE efflux family protein [Nitzschia inconspicua]|uniref:MATE efflux family protein n=1 Tax=Nitzschia inconspicua TaxID=303405 RepID=A0A9K3PMJ4_9STRA|nr:MATE efflux family protein [Nitzschia inconspicua]